MNRELRLAAHSRVANRFRSRAAARHLRSKFGFLVFSHARVRPLTYREPMRFAPSIGKSLQSMAEGVKHPEVPLILVVEGGHILRRFERELARVNARVRGVP